MDSITHIALGGLIGEVFAGRQLGKRAMVWGALAQSIPDMDIVASVWLDTPSNLLAHRGFTHSFLFAALLAPLVAWMAVRWHGPQPIGFKRWWLFFGVQISIHLLIDSLNAYGIGWFEPFSHERISFHVLFVADPFYSCWLGIAFLALILLHHKSNYRKAWAIAGITLSSIYVIYAFSNKYFIDSETDRRFQRQGVSIIRYFTTPTPLNNWLWYIVAEDQEGYHIGYRSVFDRKDSIAFQYFPRNDSLLQSLRDRDDTKKLLRFSQGYYTLERQNNTLVFNDLRFGQRIGWHNPEAKFVFRYYLEPPNDDQMIIQRGRFAGWNRDVVKLLFDRIRRD